MENMIFNYYDLLDCDGKFNFRKNNYTSMIASFLCRMFRINGLSENYKNKLLLTIYTNGSALLQKTDDPDKWIICDGHYYGIPKVDEIYPRKYLATKVSDTNAFYYDKDVTTDENTTICYVNPFLAPVTEINRFGVMLADCDTSLENNVKFCRIAPIGCVQNDKTKKQYENALDKMLRGELTNSVLTELDFQGTLQNLTTVDISNGNYSDKLQYLSMYHEQLLSRLCKLFGISYNMISKNANVTNDELDSVDVFASVLPSSMKDCLNECLAKLGLTAEFTEPWKWIDHIYEIKMQGLDKPDDVKPEPDNDTNTNDNDTKPNDDTKE